MASRCACAALSFPVRSAYIGFGIAVMGLGVRYTTANCSSAAYLVGQFVVGCRSGFRLALVVHWLFPPICVFSKPSSAPRFPHLAGVAHFVFDAVQAGLHGLASLNE